jgi:hypothetical protein
MFRAYLSVQPAPIRRADVHAAHNLAVIPRGREEHVAPRSNTLQYQRAKGQAVQMRRGLVAVLGATLLITMAAGPVRAQSVEDLTGPFSALGDLFRSLPAGLDRGPTGPLEPIFELLAERPLGP